MKSKEYIVAFIDILGFKNLVENHFNGKDKNSLSALKKGLKKAEKLALINSKKYWKSFKVNISFKQFSDCVSISMQIEHNKGATTLAMYGAFFNVVKVYQLHLLLDNILVRGGISVGGHFENSNTIFSKALINAYQLESKNAIYPRILLDKNILNLINSELDKNPNEFDMFFNLYGKSIIRDWDDEIFLSPFSVLTEYNYIKEKFGNEFVKEKTKTYSEIVKDPLFDIIADSFLEEKNILLRMQTKVNELQIENRADKAVHIKYLWLYDFITWHLDSARSRINFCSYFSTAK